MASSAFKFAFGNRQRNFGTLFFLGCLYLEKRRWTATVFPNAKTVVAQLP
jgi:hypothetical protein